MAERLYLDHAATTPLLPAAHAAMADGLRLWANPSSPHAEGRRARAMLERARGEIADALGWRHAVVLTGGASEAIALALARGRAGPRLVSAVEHDAVRRAAPEAATIPVGADGLVRLGPLPPGALIAVQHANGETGVIQPADAVGAAVRAAGGLWLADCAQTAGTLPLPDADFIVLSSHKLGGPPGAGALLVRDLAMLAPGGGQEQGYRGGTENLPAVLGMAAALAAGRGWLGEAAALRARIDAGVVALGGAAVAADSPRLATIAAYRMPGVAAAVQLIRFDMAGIAVSAGSACASGSLKPSAVLAAMGLDPATAGEIIRVSIGRTTTAAEVDRFLACWAQIAGAGA